MYVAPDSLGCEQEVAQRGGRVRRTEDEVHNSLSDREANLRMTST